MYKLSPLQAQISRPTVKLENFTQSPITRFYFDRVPFLGILAVISPNDIQL
jgi:hypothetical protein